MNFRVTAFRTIASNRNAVHPLKLRIYPSLGETSLDQDAITAICGDVNADNLRLGAVSLPTLRDGLFAAPEDGDAAHSLARQLITKI